MAKTFLCIGAGPGIGLATALRFAKADFKPILASRRIENLKSLAEEIKEKTGQEAELASLDAGNAKQVQDLALRYPDIDVLHYNAAIIHSQTLAEAAYSDLNTDILVGITGALYALKAFALPMLVRKAGTILLTGGMLALHPLPEYLTLGIAKAGIRNMTEALFNSFREKKVHIATVRVSASIAPHSREAMEVAELFWKLHSQPENGWSWEENYEASQ